AGVFAAEYARQLVEIAAAAQGRSPCDAATVAMAGASRITSRVSAILDSRRNRRAVSPRIAALGVSFGCVLILALSTMHLTARAIPQLEVQAAPVAPVVSSSKPPAQIPDKDPPTTAKTVAKKPDLTGTWVRNSYVYEWPFGNYDKWVIRQTDSELRLDASS